MPHFIGSRNLKYDMLIFGKKFLNEKKKKK